MNHFRSIALHIAIFCVCPMWSGCVYQSDVSAPNGYQIQCDKGKNCGVVSETGNTSVPVEPEVDLYDIQGKYLVGHTLPRIEPPGFQKTGYFIVDTQSGVTLVGLDESVWRSKLLQLGVKDIQLRKTAYEASKNKKY